METASNQAMLVSSSINRWRHLQENKGGNRLLLPCSVSLWACLSQAFCFLSEQLSAI